MPELVVDVFLSVDGSAFGSRSPAYFGYDGPDLERWIDEQVHREHEQVMGRRTYEALAGIPEEVRDEGWHRMVQRPTTVFSRTLQSTSWPQARITRADAVDEIRARKEKSELEMRTIGSLSVARQLLTAGLVDRLRLLVFPLVLGETGQQPFFAGLPDIALDLAGHQVLDGRVILSEYRPSGTPPYAD